MKKLLLSGLALFALLQLNAQYQITFTGSGASTSVTTVLVENITAGTSVSINGTDILNLTLATGVNSPEFSKSGLKIYPNPMNDFTTLEILPPYEGDADISVSQISGKTVFRKQVHIGNSGQGFYLTGLKKGFYLVDVKGKGFNYSGKLVSNGNSGGNLKIEETGRISGKISETGEARVSRSALATVNMAYTAGDRLKFTGSWGNYKTIVTDVPAASKSINFTFVLCRDADFNLYPVVVIGTQTWMAQNLKTTKYNDGTTAIPNVTDNATWAALVTGAYSDYLNVPTYSDTYGRLYNWYAVASTNAKNACPTGWHVPSNTEWTTLETFLGGSAGAGGKLKETGTTSWSNPNVATNETGFTAQGGGQRPLSGTPYGLMGSNGYWWTATEATPSSGYYRNMLNTGTGLLGADKDKHAGLSVRCIKD